MPLLELPHTRGCLVCGRENPFGLHLHLHVDQESGAVSCDFTPGIQHIGFEGIIHGGILATVLDEAMVWCATWAGKRFCVAGEMTVRFRRSASVGQALQVRSVITSFRPRLIEAQGSICDSAGNILAEAGGKYVPLPPERNSGFVATLVDEPSTQMALRVLQDAAGAVLR